MATETPRGYTATKDELLKRLRRGEGESPPTPEARAEELMRAVGRLMRR